MSTTEHVLEAEPKRYQILPPAAGGLYKLTLEATKYPVTSVVVYGDRAEVRRDYSKITAQIGQTEISLDHLTQYLLPDSVRVEGQTSALDLTAADFQERGEAKEEYAEENGPKQGEDVKISSSLTSGVAILDVSTTFQAIEDSQLPEERTKSEQRSRQLKALSQKKEQMELQKHRTEKQLILLEQFTRRVGGNSDENDPLSKTDDLKAILTEEGVNSFQRLSEMYERRGAELDDKLYNLEQQIQEVEEEIDAVQILHHGTALDKAGAGKYSRYHKVSVLFESHEVQEVTLSLYYVVMRASWSPLYDLRVFSREKKLVVMYKADVRQNTDEDWTNSHISLSTATPSHGGDCPELKAWNIHLEDRVFHYANRTNSKALKPMASASAYNSTAPGSQNLQEKKKRGSLSFARSRDILEESGDEEDISTADFTAFANLSTHAREGIAGAVFDIPSLANIPCDGVGHTVNVAVLELSPHFSYISCPKVQPRAYLKASAVNTSRHMFLPGPANVFLDNNFIAKSSFRDAVNAQEKFDVSLGVDNGVKVVYRPINKKEEVAGGLLSSRTNNVHYEQRIEVKNTKPREEITILVIDQIPVSSQEKLRVTVLSPNLPVSKRATDWIQLDGSCSSRLNDDQCVEWKIVIAPGKTYTAILRYDIAYPSESNLRL